MAKTQMLICPYCGEAQPLAERCRACRGFFEPLSRQATHNSMGPWYIRDPKRPHRPGCSYETLVRLVERGQIDRFSILRGPTTRQFWAVAKRVPGVSHLLGYCHNCDAHVEPTAHGCPKCGVPFGAFLNRNHLGLPDIRPLPWEAELDLSDRKQLSGNGNGEAGAGFTARPGSEPQRNVGISSFATDEELTRDAPVGRPAVVPAPSGGVSSGAAQAGVSGGGGGGEEPEFVDVPGEEPGLREEASTPGQMDAAPRVAGEAVAGDRMARTLRSTVIRQRQTIRMLTIALIVIALASAVFSAFLIRTLSSDDGQAAERNGAANAVRPAAPTQPETRGEQRTAEPGDDAARSLADDNGPAASEEEKSAEKPVEAAPPEVPAYAEALAGIEEARTLLEAARDESRPLDDRIADCEAAVDLLEAAEADVPDHALPADFAETLQRARTELERLRLSKFFP